MQTQSTTLRADYQIEQVSLDTLRQVFESDSARIRSNGFADQLNFSVNFNTIWLEILRNTPGEADADVSSPAKVAFMVKAEDPNGYKVWAIDANGRAEPIAAKRNSGQLANVYDMSHLRVADLIGYVKEHLKL